MVKRKADLHNRRTRAARAKRSRQEELSLVASEYNSAYNYDLVVDEFMGSMDISCSKCGALKFKHETKGLCCSNGNVRLPELSSLPKPLLELVNARTEEGRHFMANIRQYNACFQMTSFGAEVTPMGRFQSTFRVQGQIYHRIGSLLPDTDVDAKFLQIYFIGPEELNVRCSRFDFLRRSVISKLQIMLHTYNVYVKEFNYALEMMPSDDTRLIIRADMVPRNQHPRCFNAPTSPEIAVLMVNDEFNKRDIVLSRRGSGLQRIVETHRSYDALQYPLLFPTGDDGYSIHVPQINSSKFVSCMNYYSYRLMVRDNNYLLDFRQLLNQYVTDMYAKIESERLLFIRQNQSKLRVDEYIHLQDAIAKDTVANDIGRRVILPASFIGSPRHMNQYMQDAMTYVREFGGPSLFVTFTCNPKWLAIVKNLKDGQSASDRHDIISRVFNQKLNCLMLFLTTKSIFGGLNAYTYTIEWQKRGLPHSHILLWLKCRLHASQIDSIICAEIPDQTADKELFDVVTGSMVHGPCGSLNSSSPCMNNMKCSKRYPKQFVRETQLGVDSYPLYRRRSPNDGGNTALIRSRVDGKQTDVLIDNRWIVPYCPILCRLFKVHINVESCASVKSVKYICKYVHKGSDKAIVELRDKNNENDEVSTYQSGRYISSNEAFWRLFSFPIHDRHPVVFHLSVHLENGQRVYFTERNAAQLAENPPKTTLTAFFDLCRTDSFAKTILYSAVPQYYTWQVGKYFQRRKYGSEVEGWPGVKRVSSIGRLYTVHPSQSECFFLRLLLTVVPGPTSFSDMKSVDGVVYQTFRAACDARGLLETDKYWSEALQEVSMTCSAKQLRQLFALILTTSFPSSPQLMWDQFKDYLAEDFLFAVRKTIADASYTEEIYNAALVSLEDVCISINGKTLQQLGMASPNRPAFDVFQSALNDEKCYDRDALRKTLFENLPKLNPEQRNVFHTITNAVSKKLGGLFFLDAPGGTGKTFLINLILAHIREKGEIGLAMASSGIAATLLNGGRTAHSALKLPIDIGSSGNITCCVTKNSGRGKVLSQCSLIVWDEATMSHRKALEALDFTLRDFRKSNVVMGGVVVLLAGDFRQTLPVIAKGTPADEINACLKKSILWSTVSLLRLSTNMRSLITKDPQAENFSATLLNLGEGDGPFQTSVISFPDNFAHFVSDVENLISLVYEDFESNFRDLDWLGERCILTPTNVTTNSINNKILDMIEGPNIVKRSVDTVVDSDHITTYPVEVLNSLEPSGMPPHELNLKINAVVMLLRNMHPPKLCNGTRLLIDHISCNVIGAHILSGCGKGEYTYIPRIPTISTNMPFSFRRMQFPLRLSYAMTINKSQGQSLSVAGLYLMEPCFSHGQLYVACSRVGVGKNLFILLPPGEKSTKNIVYREALD